MSSHLNALAETETEGVQGVDVVQSPLQKFKHKTEGYAIDWSPLVPGRLISGDCNNSIYLWEPTSAATWNIDTTAFTGHTGSVEDLQWSPTEPNVFASCSVDKTIAIWDTRGRSPAASFKAHNADVNVLSWNRLASCMLASGSDDGTISIRDLRLLKLSIWCLMKLIKCLLLGLRRLWKSFWKSFQLRERACFFLQPCLVG
ncbi:protein HEAT STRESS TOLERANT DWD 1-like isoform X2 [Vicia villosa]|uniref:protein HEAT STRESS TOLERANT DWD 1-like isoform X2 n=1 Tax=Vicia villosa TaxID=3911 RepID=UPI00273B6F76|nr:protein HEAT STRESS TOLERANT DWD 1-like isoform X2 [Vicia villosa]